MNWKEAVKYMNVGGKVTRKHWLQEDYLYMKDGILYCDGGYPYLEYIKNTNGNWLKWEEH